MNSIFYYPAVFQKEEVGYSVWVPDIQRRHWYLHRSDCPKRQCSAESNRAERD